MITSGAIRGQRWRVGCLPGTRRSRNRLIPRVEAQPHSGTAGGAQSIWITPGSRTWGSPRSGLRVPWERVCGQESAQPDAAAPWHALAGAAHSHASSLVLKSMFSRLCHYYMLFQSNVLLDAV